MDQYLDEITYKFQKKIVKAWLLEGHRVDGRQKNEIRPLAAEVGVLPRVHGSGLFTRGQTQVLSVCTLDTLSAAQKLDTIWEETEKRYMHHYNFPGYSVGEAKPARSPGRREIGHGALAERALLPVIPSVEEFPYAIRVVSEVVSSNGSTSQGSICGSTLALMDAGVPIKAPVAGISCGLIQDGDDFTTFIDIQGVEDFHGEMDFKVAGTKKGITAIQMDLKNDGLTMAIIKNALDITYDARVQILDQIMLPCISEPRAEVSQYAPKMITMHIDPDKHPRGHRQGRQRHPEDRGRHRRQDRHRRRRHHPHRLRRRRRCDAAKKCIDDIVFVPEVGKLYYGRVVRLMQFGAFVELAPGKDGLVHISKLGRPARREGGGCRHRRRHDLGQGHGDRREGPLEPLPQGRPHRDRSPAGRRKGRRAAVIQIPKRIKKQRQPALLFSLAAKSAAWYAECEVLGCGEFMKYPGGSFDGLYPNHR